MVGAALRSDDDEQLEQRDARADRRHRLGELLRVVERLAVNVQQRRGQRRNYIFRFVRHTVSTMANPSNMLP